MIDDGLFEKFPCDAVFAIHNKPGVPLGHIVTKPGPLLAAADRWDIRITGKGGHAAHPHLSRRSAWWSGANVVLALQTIVSRNIDPLDATVVTVGFFKARLGLQRHPGRRRISAAPPAPPRRRTASWSKRRIERDLRAAPRRCTA